MLHSKNSINGGRAKDDNFADDMETEVTAAQAVGLAFTGIATVAMAYAAFQMKRKIGGNVGAGGLIANEAAVYS